MAMRTPFLRRPVSGPVVLLVLAVLLASGCKPKPEEGRPPPAPAAPKPEPAAAEKQRAIPESAKAPAAPASAEPAAVPVAKKPVPRHVEVKGAPGSFQLLVDGRPYFIKGVGFNVDSLEFAEKEIALAKETGFNSLRLWGQGQANLAGLDLAEKYGMTVVPAWWLSQDTKGNPIGRDYSNEKQNAAEVAAIVEWVNELKDHPAVLMWGIGNESYHMSGQGEAYAKFMEQVCQAIHKADPHHPVISVDVNLSPIWDFAKFAPSLDLYGCNTYSGWTAIKSAPVDIAKTMKRPVVFTEFGPGLPAVGSKAVPKLQAQAFVDCWKKGILAMPGHTLGGYFFVFRDGRPDDTWFGIYDFRCRPKSIITQAIKNALTATGAPDSVKVAPRGEGFELQLNGSPYWVKGVVLEAADFAKESFDLAAAIGFNTIRVPVECADRPEFDFLPGYGLRAIVRIPLPPEYARASAPGDKPDAPAAGAWMPTGRDYRDAEQNKRAIEETLKIVEKHKGKPGLLIWELGNETYAHCANREAFAVFLNDLCRAVKTADPNHPIVHTTAYTVGVEDFARLTPELDILGDNSYAGPGLLVSAARLVKKKMNRPTLFMVSAFLDEGPTRANLNEEVKTWMDTEIWKRGVLRSRPYAIGGFYRAMKDGPPHGPWGFIRKDGTLKQPNVEAVKEVLLEPLEP